MIQDRLAFKTPPASYRLETVNPTYYDFVGSIPLPTPRFPSPPLEIPMSTEFPSGFTLGPCDLCGALAPRPALLPLGQVDFLLETPTGRQFTGSRPLRCCRPPWRQDPALHRAALAWAPLSLTRTGRFTRRSCQIRWRDLPGNGCRPQGASPVPHFRKDPP